MKTSDEIIEIISKHFTKEEFAYDDFEVPDNVDFLPKDIKEKYEKYRKNFNEYVELNQITRKLLTLEQIKRIEELKKEVSYTYDDVILKLYFEHLGLGEIKEIEQVGGEGKGEHWYSVKYFPEHDVYIKIVGIYTSYSGTEFDDYGFEVKPKTKIITVYE